MPSVGKPGSEEYKEFPYTEKGYQEALAYSEEVGLPINEDVEGEDMPRGEAAPRPRVRPRPGEGPGGVPDGFMGPGQNDELRKLQRRPKRRRQPPPTAY